MENTTTNTKTDRVDTLLRILADSERRRIITALRATPSERVPLEELTQRVCDSGRDLESTRIRLHHNHLPELEQAGIITCDTHMNTIEYHGDHALESLLDTLQTETFAPTPRQVNRED